MTQNEVVLLLAWFFGYLQQFLRAFKWYNDGVTLAISIALGTLGQFWIGGAALADARSFTFGAVTIAMAILGGTSVATMAAQNTNGRLAPKFNQFGAVVSPDDTSGGTTK